MVLLSGSPAHAQTSVPSQPTGLAVSSASHDSVTLTWDDPGDGTIESYQVLRRSRDGSKYGDGKGAAGFVAIVDSTGSPATIYTDRSVAPRTRYVYRVKARNPQGLSERSRYANAETQAAPPPAPIPSMPAGLAVPSVSHDSVTLAWDDPGDNTIESYQLLRRSRDGSEYGDSLGAAEFIVIVDDTGSSATTYTDTSVTARTRYAYRVKARNSQGLSESSGVANAETPEGPVAPPVAVEPAPPACPAAESTPTATEVAVAAVPIVVASTTADYFVLYASFDVDGTTVEYPVQVTLGQHGTTTLTENVAALPPERYRVEKYSIDDPADVDGDCIDDIAELSDPVGMNPVNPADTIEPANGALAVPDRETFEALAFAESSGLFHLKLILVDMDTARPSVYFQNTERFLHHRPFRETVNVDSQEGHSVVRGTVIYDPGVVAPDGSRGLYRYFTSGREMSFGASERIFTLLAASMPVLDDDLALWVSNWDIPQIQADLALYEASRVSVVFDADVYGETSFLALNPGEGFELLRSLGADERPGSRDVVIYGALPNELPRVAGIISTVAQTPLSHVNLRALQDGVPNAFIADALEDAAISDLVDSFVYYAVSDAGYEIRAATQAEVDEFYAASRPAAAQTPQRDLTVTAIAALGDIGFGDWDAFGVKAANVAVLGTLGFAEGTVPHGFAVPFYFYDEFMKHNDLYDYVDEMLADTDFQTDAGTRVDELKKLRKKIKKAATPAWIDTALTAMHATFAEATSLRYRSSTNNEDLPGFNGAGLYDSKTQHPDETEEDGISKSLKQVYASLWNYRAFTERDFHRVDHRATAMGVLVHPNYSDEQVNGVAVSTDPAYGTDGTFYLNSQTGEDLVTNPEAHSVPEEVLLYPDGTYSVVSLSNQVTAGQLLMTHAQLAQLRRHLATIHDRFAERYGVADGERFAMEIEFKITSDNTLAIKQARPWIFTDPPPDIDDTTTQDPDALTASVETAPANHDGEPFGITVQFSEGVSIGAAQLRDQAFVVTGGTVTQTSRVNRQNDWWKIVVTPDSPFEKVTLVLAANRPCAVPGTICTFSGGRLSTRLEHTVKGLPPSAPDRPTGTEFSSGVMALSWNDVSRADWYEVQLLDVDGWIGLPADGIEVTFDGAGVVVSGLASGEVHSFRVRALNSHGASEWSPWLSLPSEVVLESELVAARDGSVSPVASGFSVLGGFGGSLTPDRFVFEGTSYEVVFLSHTGGRFWLGTNVALPADFTLVVGDRSYRGSESLFAPTVAAGGSYWWPSPPEWFGDEAVRVSLVLHPGVPLGDRATAPPTGYFGDFPAEHDVAEDISFRVYFIEGVTATADVLRDHVLAVSGGAVSGVEAASVEGRTWEVTVTPDERAPITITITADLDCDLVSAVCTADRRRLFNPMELTVAAKPNHQPTGAPIVSGQSHAGETLTVDTSTIADADGMTGASFAYQWTRSDGRRETPIGGAAGTSYTLTDADEGKAIRVRVSFTDDAANAETLTSAPAYSQRPYALAAQASDGAVTLTWKIPAGWRYVRSYYQILRNRPELGETEPTVHVRYFETNDRTYTYTDTDVDPGVLYMYRVKGVDLFGLTHEASPPVEIRTPPPAPTNNTPAAGAPTVDGEPVTGGTLTADTTGMSDADGMDGASFAYQWLADDADIADATAAAYTPADDDENKTLKVRVTFTDNNGNTETLTSAPTAPITAPTAAVIELTAQFLDAPASHDGQNPFTFELRFSEEFGLSYADLRDHTFTVTGGTVTRVRRLAPPGNIRWQVTVLPDSDDAVFVVLPATQNCTNQRAVCTGDGRKLSAEVTLTVVGPQQENSPATGAPTISGTAQVGETLTASTSGISDDDGLANATFSYQWLADDTDISGATGNTYTLADADEGKAIKVRVSFADDAGNDEALTSAATAVVESKPNIPATGVPTIGGTVQAGETLTASTSGISDDDGLANVTFSYQWLADDTDISGATGNTYTLADADEGKAIKVRVSFADDAGNDEALTSAATTVVESKPNIPATGVPTIGGTVQAGETLTASTSGISDDDGLANAAFSYQWLADDTAISGATGNTYTLADADEGKAIKVRVSFADDAGNDEALTSAATAVVESKPNIPATGAPIVSGTALVGETLNVNTSVIEDEDGLSNANFSYQWVSNHGSADADIQDATSSTYTLVDADQGKAIKVRVSFTDDGGNLETRTSEKTDLVLSALVWSATMQVAALYAGNGYNSLSGVEGELSETSFNLDSVTYTITTISAGGWMYINVDKELPSDLTFEVDGVRFLLNDASSRFYNYNSQYEYFWSEAGTNWRVGATVQLALYH